MTKKKHLKAIIIEDEENGRLLLNNLLEKHCPNVKIVGMSSNIKDAIPIIIDKEPDVVFLDIELPEGNGFTLFNYFSFTHFHTIFVSAHSEYALRALKMSAVDYILKPIDPDELVLAVKKVDNKNIVENNEKINSLVNNINKGVIKVALPTMEGLNFVDFNNIIRCEAENNYTLVYLLNSNKLLISKTLSYFEDILSDFQFFRVNRYCLVNLNYIVKFQRGKKNYVHLSDGTALLLSDGKKEEFMTHFAR